MQRQVWYTLLLLALASTSLLAFLDTQTDTMEMAITPTNLIAVATIVVSLVFTAGSIREQFTELRARVGKLEDRLDTDVPTVYVRKDVFEAHTKNTSPLT